MESFSLPNLFFLSPNLEFGSATGLWPNPSPSGQENTPWTVLLVALVNTHQVNNLVLLRIIHPEGHPGLPVQDPSLWLKNPSFAWLTNLVLCFYFFVSALLANTHEWRWGNPTGSVPPSSTHPFNTNLFLHLFFYLACKSSSYLTRNIEVHYI